MRVHLTQVQSLPRTRSGAAKSKTYRPRDLQKNPDLFPEGSDAWMALNAGHSIKLDERGFIVEVWDRNGNHYDPMTGDRIAPSHGCGATTKKDGNPLDQVQGRLCQRRVKGSSGPCFQHK